MCSAKTHLRQDLLYSFVHSPPDDGLVEAEMYRRDIINNKFLFIFGCENCWVKYCIFSLLQGIWATLNSHLDHCSEAQAYVLAVFKKKEYGKVFFISKERFDIDF
jgi:hypothetical protein